MEDDDREIEDTLSPFTTPITEGQFYAKALVWFCYFQRHADRAVQAIAKADRAASEFVELRDRQKAVGLESVQEPELVALGRLVELLRRWRSTGELSPEIELLARITHRALADRPESAGELPPLG